MGGAVSELRHAIHAHVLIARHYPAFLEPYLVVVQFFLRTAETGEGANPDHPVDVLPMDVVTTDKRIFEEASTEIELLVENALVMQTLLRAVETYRSLALAPDLDPLKRWYDPPWRTASNNTRPMPQFLDIRADEVARFQIAVLRTSIRCLRLMMNCADARARLEELNGPQLLNNAVLENALDDFIKNDVKAIFSAVYGGENAVRRIVLANVQITVEMVSENRDSAIVHLAGAKRLCQLLADANVIMYTPAASQLEAAMSSPHHEQQEAIAQERCVPIFRDMDTFGAVPLLISSLARFDVNAYLSLYFHVCRFISFVAVETHNAKLVGQHGGVDGAIRLLFRARELQRQKKQAERDELARHKRLQESPHADWLSILEVNNRSAPWPPAVMDAAGVQATSLAALAVVEFTPTEIGQMAMWALDLLATLDFNVSLMKLHKLKYLLEEIRLDPDGKELGDALIVTRRLRLIRWDQVGLPPPSS
uniref:Uncharacterized protein n=1 Tax=Globisporangium ultimum (strain ATCC 200006 / CBS 805.95 / DAOM BR144) TaxID=431595 RepID=K3XAZ3_GLOUD